MDDKKLFRLMQSIDPQTKRIPPFIRQLVDEVIVQKSAIYELEIRRLRQLFMIIHYGLTHPHPETDELLSIDAILAACEKAMPELASLRIKK